MSLVTALPRARRTALRARLAALAVIGLLLVSGTVGVVSMTVDRPQVTASTGSAR